MEPLLLKRQKESLRSPYRNFINTHLKDTERAVNLVDSHCEICVSQCKKYIPRCEMYFSHCDSNFFRPGNGKLDPGISLIITDYSLERRPNPNSNAVDKVLFRGLLDGSEKRLSPQNQRWVELLTAFPPSNQNHNQVRRHSGTPLDLML